MDTNPQPWQPYSRDCSRGICSYYCPQRCFFLFPPPPPSPPSHPLLSPLLVAVIAIASTIFVLVAYYIILAHYRRTRARARSSVALSDNPSWQATCRDGLDESLIERIAACQYRAGGGLIVDGTDCSVCLSQFEDGDQIRLLPKCSHPFHLTCIDTWLKSHSTCPLCRAGIFPLPAVPNDAAINTTTTIIVEENEESPQSGSDTETVDHELVEIQEGGRVIGRSLSMDSSFRQRAEPNSNLDMNTDTDTSTWSRALHSILISPIQMKRSRSHTSILPT